MAEAFARREEAVAVVEKLGMKFNYSSMFDGREYWHYGDGTDALLDHSATIHEIGDKFYLSLFDRKVPA